MTSRHLETPNDAFLAMAAIASTFSGDVTYETAVEMIGSSSTPFINLARRMFGVNRALDVPENAVCFENCRKQLVENLSRL